MLTKLKISTRVYLGFGVILGALAVVALLNLSGVIDTSDDFKEYQEINSDYKVITEVLTDVFEVEKLTLDWVRLEESSILEQIKLEDADLIREIEVAKKAITDPARAASVLEIERRFAVFDSSLDKIIELTEKRNSIFSTLTVSGRIMVDGLSQIQQTAARDSDFESATRTAELLETILLGRTFAARFFDTADMSDASVAQEKFGATEQLVAALDRSLQNFERRRILDQVTAQLPVYREEFDEVIRIVSDRRQIINKDLIENGNKIALLAEEVQASVLEELKEISQGVDDSLSDQFSFSLALFIIGVLIGAILAFFIARSIIHPIRDMTKVVQTLADGETRFDVPFTNMDDEIGAMARATEELRVNAKRAFMLNTALDCVDTNVLVADENRVIIYANPAVRRMLSNKQNEIRKSLPRFDVATLVGDSIDQFHKNPSHQAELLARFTDPVNVDMALGDARFDLTAFPVTNDKGERLGSLVQWLDVTQERLVEAEVASIVAKASAGDFAERIAEAEKDGFMLQLAQGVNQILDTTQRAVDDLGDVMGAMAGGDLSRRVENDYEGAFGELKDSSNGMAEKLSDIVGQILEAVDHVGTAAREISAGSGDLSERTEQQAASLEETAASMEQLSSTVRQNADNAQEADGLAASASAVADQGGQVVRDAVSAMGSISESAQKISDIIGVIDEIAFQTNLLALNAAVEAARAGEAGKGFAVVAAEVRTLAQRSAQASKEIKQLIEESTVKVQQGVSLVNETGDSLDEIVGSVKKVAEIIAEIAAASREQASGLDQVNTAVAEMDEMTQKNAALVEESTAAAKSLEEQSGSLSGLVGFFRMDGTARGPAPAYEIQSPVRRGAMAGPARRSAPVVDDDPDWKEF